MVRSRRQMSGEGQTFNKSAVVQMVSCNMYRYSRWSVTLCVPVCGVRQTAGGACEVTGGTEQNWKWFILTLLPVRLNYLSEQHREKVTMQVSSFSQDRPIFSKCKLKSMLQTLWNRRFTLPPPDLLPHPHAGTYIVTLQAEWEYVYRERVCRQL